MKTAPRSAIPPSHCRPWARCLAALVLSALTLPIPALSAAGAAIYGRIQPAMTQSEANPPIRLVHALDPADRASLAKAAGTLAGLLEKGYQPTDRPSDPANHPALLERIHFLDTLIPPPTHQSIRLGTAGIRRFSTADALILRYRTAIREIQPERYAEGVEALTDRISGDLRALRRTVTSGFADDTAAVELLGIRTNGTKTDAEGAIIVGQAIVNLEWLIAFANAFGSALPELTSSQGLVPADSSPEAAWDAFRIGTLPQLLNRVDLATINQTGPRPDGRFALRGEGLLLVEIPAFGITLPLPEDTPNAPFDIERLQP